MISWAASDGRGERADEVVPAASTIKVFVVSAFWRSGLDPAERVEVEPTPFSLSDRLAGPLTLADCALLALAVSDNAATNALLDRLGFDAVNAELARLGLERTVVRRRMISDGPENLTCAGDLARGLAAVAAEEPRVVDALERAADSLLPHLVGPEVRVAVKTGELPGVVYHELALLSEGGRSLAVAACSASPERPDRVAEAVAAVWRGASPSF